MNFYEHTIIAKQDISTPELNNIEKKYKDIITKTDGKVIKVEKWGLLNFAKKIKAYNKGFYIHYKFEAENKTLEEINKNSVIDNSLLRHLTVKYKKLDTETDGEIIKIEKWGLLGFANKIKAYKKGFYIHYKFEAKNKTLEEIKRNSIIDNSLLRHLTVKYKKLDTETEYFKENNEKKK